MKTPIDMGMERPNEYLMPNGEVIKVWNDGELFLDLNLQSDFEYYATQMEELYGIELKP